MQVANVFDAIELCVYCFNDLGIRHHTVFEEIINYDRSRDRNTVNPMINDRTSWRMGSKSQVAKSTVAIPATSATMKGIIHMISGPRIVSNSPIERPIEINKNAIMTVDIDS